MTRLIQRLYLCLFLADALLSLTVAHDWLALAVAALSLPLWVAVVATPRFSPWLLTPAWFAVWAVFCRAFPLNMMEDARAAQWTLTVAQLLIGSGGLLLWNSRRAEREPFAWRHTLLMAALSVAGGVSLTVAAAGGWLVRAADDHYTRLTFSGVSLREKHFAKDGREVWLVGMMHVGQDEFYNNLADRLPKDRRALVLLEGVSNRNNLPLTLDYSRMANWLGTGDQRRSKFTKQAESYLQATAEGRVGKSDNKRPRYVQADADLADFHPDTLLVINSVGELYNSRDWREAWQRYQQLSKRCENIDQRQLWRDLLDLRNERVLANLERYQAPLSVIPWGAMHMPQLERELLRRGYVETGRMEHRVLKFASLGKNRPAAQSDEAEQPDRTPGAEQYRPAAEQGDAPAQFWVGYCYLKGQGVPRDAVQAVEWFRRAAEQNHAKAQVWLAHCYQHGKGVGKDLAAAEQWFQKAAEQGDEYAREQLAKAKVE